MPASSPYVAPAPAASGAPTLSSAGAQRVVVSICTYNERENVERMIDEVLMSLPTATMLVVDDGSPDGTGALADAYAARDSRVNVIHRSGKLGLGSAVIEAMRWTLARDYEFFVYMDADFSHPPADLPRLLAAMEQYDVTIGSRYVPGGKINGWSWKRHVMSRGINWYSRLLLGIHANDTSGGFRCHRVSKLREIDFDAVYSRGYSFFEEFLFHLQRAGCRIGEIPIVFDDRVHGTSKINKKEAALALWALAYTAVRRRGRE